jgi:threonine aldolase
VRVLDFRSDTVTQPTDAMRKAMAEADVGDDVYGEDPTVRKLEEASARLVGMEAALFVPTGTMGNQVAVWAHSGRHGTLVCEENCHIALYEGGGAALLSGVQMRTVAGRAGVFGAEEMARHFPPPGDSHFSPVRIVAIENTHNYAGGRTWSAEATRAACDFAQERGAAFHIDGARIFNAAVAQKTTAARLCEGADSVMFCLSKGLSAPVGSLLCGSSQFVAKAHAVRKILGGGMRQAGHLAAAGLVALGLVDRLAKDHATAKVLERGLADHVDVLPVETNMVMADVSKLGLDSAGFIDQARRVGVLLTNRDAGPVVRFVTHRNVTADDAKEALERLGPLLGKKVGRSSRGPPAAPASGAARARKAR